MLINNRASPDGNAAEITFRANKRESLPEPGAKRPEEKAMKRNRGGPINPSKSNQLVNNFTITSQDELNQMHRTGDHSSKKKAAKAQNKSPLGDGNADMLISSDPNNQAFASNTNTRSNN